MSLYSEGWYEPRGWAVANGPEARVVARETVCWTCGHEPKDHGDGMPTMEASIEDRWYCHATDHSCYMAALIDKAANDYTLDIERFTGANDAEEA